MRRFEFSLEAALRWRQSKLEVEELKLRRLSVELADLEQRGRDLEHGQALERGHVQTSGVSIAERAGLGDYLRWAYLERERLRAAADDCRTHIDRQRSSLVEARRSHELLVKLKSRRQREWDQDYAREVENLASEAFLSRWKPKEPPMNADKDR